MRSSRSAIPGLHPCWLLLAGALAAPPGAVASPPPGSSGEAILTYDLGAAGAAVLPGGEIVVHDAAGVRLLTIRPSFAGPLRPERSFAGLFAEGEPGGRRGLDPDADDDRDGLVDEDTPNGSDDDGDGRRDEDFAAIGEAMTVVDLTCPGGRLHEEIYHWSYPHLRRGLIASVRLAGPGGEPAEGALLATAAGGAWRLGHLEMAGELFDREVTPAARAFILPLPREGQGDRLWLGVSLLTPLPVGGRLPVASGPRLEAPFTGALEVALAVAPSRLQLARQLAAAHRVRQGVADGKGGRMAWTIPPLCRICLTGESPAASWARQEDGWILSLHVRPGQDALIDPDRLHISGHPLPAADRIEWRPEAEDGTSLPDAGWSVLWGPSGEGLPAEDLLPDLYGATPDLLRHSGRGTLRLFYRGAPPWLRRSDAPVLCGESLSGRPFARPLPPDPSPEPLVAGASGPLRPSSPRGSPQQLLGDLLRSHPNPLTERTLFTFQVPATLGEAFPPETAVMLGDPARPLAETGGALLVSLKIYNLGGAEVAELRRGWLASGRYEAGWDGSDRYGRPVPAGTYFCKLQIDRWSLTKRVVVLR